MKEGAHTLDPFGGVTDPSIVEAKMSDDHPPSGDPRRSSGRGAGATAGFSVAAAVVGFLFGWLILDDLALGIVFGFFGGMIGAGAARARARKEDGG